MLWQKWKKGGREEEQNTLLVFSLVQILKKELHVRKICLEFLLEKSVSSKATTLLAHALIIYKATDQCIQDTIVNIIKFTLVSVTESRIYSIMN